MAEWAIFAKWFSVVPTIAKITTRRRSLDFPGTDFQMRRLNEDEDLTGSQHAKIICPSEAYKDDTFQASVIGWYFQKFSHLVVCLQHNHIVSLQVLGLGEYDETTMLIFFLHATSCVSSSCSYLHCITWPNQRNPSSYHPFDVND